MELKLKKFDITKINKNSFIFVFGAIGTGKTYLVKHLIKEKLISSRYYNVISPVYNEYDKVISDLFLFENIQKYENQLDDIHRILPNINTKYQLIIDDAIDNLSDVGIYKIRYLITNRKRYNSSIILTQHKLFGIPSYIRKKIDYLFLFYTNQDCMVTTKDINLKLFKYFGKKYNCDFETFKSIIDTITSNRYNCLVIDLKCNNMEEAFYWYNALIFNIY